MRAWLLLSTIAFIAITAGDATEADNGDNCSSIAFIFKAYTASPSLVERLALAQQQFTACGGYFRVIYTFQDLVNGTQEDQAAAAARAAADVGALRAALGREAVIGLGPADYAVVFGTEWARLKEHEGLSGKWPKNFLWTHCDAPELAWFDMFSRDLPLTVKHVWTAEWDVGWTGSLPGILLTFPRDADYICFAHRTYGIRPRPNWTWAETRSWLDQGEIRRCAVFLTRWSWALLTAFRGETRLGHMQYCEASGASICAKHNLWCSIDTFNESSPLIGKTRAGKALFAFNTKIHESTWRRIEHDARIQGFTQERPGQLYHKLRFDELKSSAAAPVEPQPRPSATGETALAPACRELGEAAATAGSASSDLSSTQSGWRAGAGWEEGAMEDVEPGPAGPPMPAPPPAHQAAFGPLAGPHADAWGPQQPEPMDQEPWQPAHDLWDEPWPQPQPQLWAFVGGQWQLVPPAVLHAHPELWQQALQQQAWQEQAWQQQALQQQQLAIEQQQQAWQGAAPLAAPARPAESDCSSVRRPGGGGAPGSPTASSACSVPASRRLASHERNARHMRQLEQYVRQASRTVDPRRPALLDPAIPLPPLRQPPPNEDVRLIATRQLPCWPPRERRGTGAGAEQGLGPGGSELQADGTGAGPGPGSDADRHHQQAGAPMQAREEGPLPDVGPGEGGGREVAMGTEV